MNWFARRVEVFVGCWAMVGACFWEVLVISGCRFDEDGVRFILVFVVEVRWIFVFGVVGVDVGCDVVGIDEVDGIVVGIIGVVVCRGGDDVVNGGDDWIGIVVIVVVFVFLVFIFKLIVGVLEINVLGKV